MWFVRFCGLLGCVSIRPLHTGHQARRNYQLSRFLEYATSHTYGMETEFPSNFNCDGKHISETGAAAWLPQNARQVTLTKGYAQNWPLPNPFYWHGLTSIPAWIGYYIHYNVWDEMSYPFPTLNRATVEVYECISNFIPHFTGHVITNPCLDWS